MNEKCKKSGLAILFSAKNGVTEMMHALHEISQFSTKNNKCIFVPRGFDFVTSLTLFTFGMSFPASYA